MHTPADRRILPGGKPAPVPLDAPCPGSAGISDHPWIRYRVPDVLLADTAHRRDFGIVDSAGYAAGGGWVWAAVRRRGGGITYSHWRGGDHRWCGFDGFARRHDGRQ